MKSWTVHLKPDREPVLLREGWSWGAFLFGPFWLLFQRAWVPAALWLALTVVLPALAPAPARPVVGFALSVLAGLLGRDLVRWSLPRRGYELAHVLAARDEEGALARLFAARPDLAGLGFAPVRPGLAERFGRFGRTGRPEEAA